MIKINGKKCYNLQEQVGVNKDNIYALRDWIEEIAKTKHLKSITKDEDNKTITITDSDDNVVTFTYGGSGSDLEIKQVGESFEFIQAGQKVGTISSFSPVLFNQVQRFGYEVLCLDLDYEYAEKYLEDKFLPVGGCSSVRKDNVYGRNYDFYYNNDISYIVRTPRIANRYASIGNAFFNQYNNENKKVIPFVMLDGINENGVFANLNLVADNKGNPAHIYPAMEEETEVVMATMLVRIILDNFRTARSACEYIRDYLTVKMPQLYGEFQEMHLMVGDENETLVLEFIGNHAEIIESDKLTNFYMTGVKFNLDGSVTIDSNNEDESSVGVTLHGQGLERWNLINESLAEEKFDMELLLTNTILYTNAYQLTGSAIWKTEFVGIYDDVAQKVYTVTQNPSDADFQAFFGKIQEAFAHRNRDNPITWQTVHSAIYDIEKRTMKVRLQEEGHFSSDYSIIQSIISDKKTTPQDILDNTIGSEFISVDLSDKGDKAQIDFDFTNLNQFITFPSIQGEVILDWIDEKGWKLRGTLNQEVTNKINNSLQLPKTHTEHTIVGVDTTGSQEQIRIGGGLQLLNGTLSTNLVKYKHEVSIYSSTYSKILVKIFIINNYANPLDLISLQDNINYVISCYGEITSFNIYKISWDFVNNQIKFHSNWNVVGSAISFEFKELEYSQDIPPYSDLGLSATDIVTTIIY